MKQFLDKEQVQALIDMGVDMTGTGLMLFGEEYYLPIFEEQYQVALGEDEATYPTLTIGELIERLPLCVKIEEYNKPCLTINKTKVYYLQHGSYSFSRHSELIDNLYDCYIQLIKDGVIKL